MNIYPHFNFMSLYNQSSGYTKMQEDNIISSNTNIAYGGAVSTMYGTTIYKISPYNPTLNVGSMQK